MLINESVARVNAGTTQAELAGAQMVEIVAAIEKVSALISDISSASNEQASGIEQISHAVNQMDEVTQQNAALVEQAAAAAESLQEQSAQLARAVAAFRMYPSSRTAAPAAQVAARVISKAAHGQAAMLTARRTETLPTKLARANASAESDWAEF